ncbi:MAG: pyrroline-5-carboxylate reductase [Acidimicrobiales bacterium]
MERLELIGGGRMGEALLAGLLANGWATADEVAVVEPVAARRDELVGRYPGLTGRDAPAGAEGVIIAVKPGHVAEVARSLRVLGPDAVGRVLSIAAGVTIATIESELGGGLPVVRAMPNTPALVGAGASAIAGGTHATADDLAWAEAVLGAVGIVVRVTEGQLDAVTGLSGSGPAYVFLVAEALIEAGVLVGLPRDVSTDLAVQTLLGSARLLAETGDDAATLRAAVTSPGGTTAAGLRALEDRATRAALIAAVVAARDRSAELAGH